MRRSLMLSVVAAVFLVPTTPAWAAGHVNVCIAVYLDGVDKCGCLTCLGGECATFYGLLNTCTAKFTGKACGCVANCSCKEQTYKCQNFFCDPCWCVCVKNSTYCVHKTGKCKYIAIGTAVWCGA